MKNLDDILKGTSRAFYLTLRALPAGSRAPMSLAYLLARAADTIADSECESEADRSTCLLRFSAAVSEPDQDFPSLESFCPISHREKDLLNITEDLIANLHGQPGPLKLAIQEVIRTLISGMLWDQERFGQNSSKDLNGLSDQEFDEYCYLVAGCVGPFWSQICALSNSDLKNLLADENLDIARRFGKALQHVNILRDIPADQELGRYYLPHLNRQEFPIRFVEHSRQALAHFRSASSYPNLFGRWEVRDKISVFLPLALGLRTLEKLFLFGLPRPNTRIKVQRSEVLIWLAFSPVIVLIPQCLPKLLNYLAERAESALSQLEKNI